MIDMDEKLMEWMKMRWRYDNLPKYQKYFEGWVNGLTEGQVQGFAQQLVQIENGSIEKWNTKR